MSVFLIFLIFARFYSLFSLSLSLHFNAAHFNVSLKRRLLSEKWLDLKKLKGNTILVLVKFWIVNKFLRIDIFALRFAFREKPTFFRISRFFYPPRKEYVLLLNLRNDVLSPLGFRNFRGRDSLFSETPGNECADLKAITTQCIQWGIYRRFNHSIAFGS